MLRNPGGKAPLDKNEFARLVRERARQEVPRNLRTKVYENDFDAAIRYLGLTGFRPFDNWRRGRSKPPQWIADLINDELAWRADRAQLLASKIVASTGDRGGTIGTKALRAWRAAGNRPKNPGRKKREIKSQGVSKREHPRQRD